MKIRIYQVDAFTRELFHGNPAAVCPLETWLPDETMQQIAMENNLAETAFYVKGEGGYRIRWFTPLLEVDLCGHATLAAAYVLFHFEGCADPSVEFASRSGPLTVRNDRDCLTLNFPTDRIEKTAVHAGLIEAIGLPPIEAYKGKTDYMLVYSKATQVENLIPDMELLAEVPARGVIVTAPGSEVDFVSRFFAPQTGIPEDPVTGSAHTTLTPYWSSRLGKTELTAQQLSKRRGWLRCRLAGERVEISGEAKAYMNGWIDLG